MGGRGGEKKREQEYWYGNKLPTPPRPQAFPLSFVRYASKTDDLMTGRISSFCWMTFEERKEFRCQVVGCVHPDTRVSSLMEVGAAFSPFLFSFFVAVNKPVGNLFGMC